MVQTTLMLLPNQETGTDHVYFPGPPACPSSRPAPKETWSVPDLPLALSFLHRVGQGDAAEYLVELAALAVHAFHLPAVEVHHLDHLLGELRGPRLVLRIDAEGAVEFLHPAKLGQALGARARACSVTAPASSDIARSSSGVPMA